mgnify:FL=1
MKIHIIGTPGSGKSFLADNLSKQFDIPHYDLDDLQWDNAAMRWRTICFVRHLNYISYMK